MFTYCRLNLGPLRYDVSSCPDTDLKYSGLQTTDQFQDWVAQTSIKFKC